jgi:hypothetical protein
MRFRIKDGRSKDHSNPNYDSSYKRQAKICRGPDMVVPISERHDFSVVHLHSPVTSSAFSGPSLTLLPVDRLVLVAEK